MKPGLNLLFGHPLRSLVPAHESAFDPKWQAHREDVDKRMAKEKADSKSRYDETAKSLPPFKVGDEVRIQDSKSKRWVEVGIVVEKRKRRSYLVKLPSGRVRWRNRRFLRQFHPESEVEEVIVDPGAAGCETARRQPDKSGGHEESGSSRKRKTVTFDRPEEPRRSKRKRKKPVQYSNM